MVHRTTEYDVLVVRHKFSDHCQCRTLAAYFKRRADVGNINISLILVHSLIGSKYKCVIPMPYQYFECWAKDIEGGTTIY